MNMKDFKEITKEFIEFEKDKSKEIKYVDGSDLGYLYRFITGTTNAFEIVNKSKWRLNN